MPAAETAVRLLARGHETNLALDETAAQAGNAGPQQFVQQVEIGGRRHRAGT